MVMLLPHPITRMGFRLDPNFNISNLKYFKLICINSLNYKSYHQKLVQYFESIYLNSKTNKSLDQ